MLLVLLCVSLSSAAPADNGAQAAIEKGQAAITRQLTDPESAQFRSVTASQRGDKWIVCGEVNAKNQFGGYVGFKRFYVSDGQPGVDNDEYFPILFKALCAGWSAGD